VSACKDRTKLNHFVVACAIACAVFVWCIYIAGRIDLCEVAITKKLDKSSLGHIESLVVDLEKYANHRRAAEAKISSLEAETARLLLG